jgi:hypothetical protein
MASLVVGFPFDTGMSIFRSLSDIVYTISFLYFRIQVKVRFQSPAIAKKYHSTFHAITTIIREERFIGLYKGITSPLVIHGFLMSFRPNFTCEPLAFAGNSGFDEWPGIRIL